MPCRRIDFTGCRKTGADKAEGKTHKENRHFRLNLRVFAFSLLPSPLTSTAFSATCSGRSDGDVINRCLGQAKTLAGERLSAISILKGDDLSSVVESAVILGLTVASRPAGLERDDSPVEDAPAPRPVVILPR